MVSRTGSYNSSSKATSVTDTIVSKEVTSQLSVSADQATKWYESNLLAGNLKKYQTLNIGYSKKTVSSASAVIVANNQKIKTADTLKL